MRVLVPLLFLMLAGCGSSPDTGHPNVILVMTDDQGYGDFGFMGNPVIRTPNLDQMASRSAMMTRFYVSPVCAPTRASLMTGRYNYRTRAIDTYLGRAMMEPEEVTIAEVLRDAGYATGIFGKWHLGDTYGMRPQDQGFAETLVLRGGGIGQPSDPPGGEAKYTDPILFHNGEQQQMTGYCTDIFFDNALDFLAKNVAAGRPSFVYIATNAPHGPFGDVPEDLYHSYAAEDLRPALAPDRNTENDEQLLDRTARIFAMITNIDDNIGKLFERLDELGIYDDTLVLFLTDNGPNGPRWVGNLRGRKGQVLEGGIRTPLLAHWPAVLHAGESSDRVAAHYDIFPTILEAAGVPKPAGLRLDGRSLLPLLRGQQVQWPDRTIYLQWHRGDHPVRYRKFAAVGQRHKLLHQDFAGTVPPAGTQFELYDLLADPGETSNLATRSPDTVARFRRAYDDWFDNVSSTRPDNYAPPRIQIGTPYENPTVLTRQDWRHGTESQGWRPDAVGWWLLHVASAGTYDIRVTFKPREQAETLELSVAGFEQTASVKAGAREFTFQDAELTAGDTRLDAALTHSGKRRGVWQVYVTKRD